MDKTTEIQWNHNTLNETRRQKETSIPEISHIPPELEWILEWKRNNPKKSDPPMWFLDDPLIWTTWANED